MNIYFNNRYAKSNEQKLISRWANQLINLIFSDEISTISRPIFLLRHLNSSSRNTLAGIIEFRLYFLLNIFLLI